MTTAVTTKTAATVTVAAKPTATKVTSETTTTAEFAVMKIRSDEHKVRSDDHNKKARNVNKIRSGDHNKEFVVEMEMTTANFAATTTAKSSHRKRPQQNLP